MIVLVRYKSDHVTYYKSSKYFKIKGLDYEVIK